MDVSEQIEAYLSGQPEPKKRDLRELHQRILAIRPESRLWFLDGKDSTGKTVSNPNIGYGAYTIKYADGKTREFYQVGISANTAGISVYVMGIEDKTFLSRTFKAGLGKATVTGYCIRFKALKDINIDVLEAAIRQGFQAQQEKPGR